MIAAKMGIWGESWQLSVKCSSDSLFSVNLNLVDFRGGPNYRWKLSRDCYDNRTECSCVTEWTMSYLGERSRKDWEHGKKNLTLLGVHLCNIKTVTYLSLSMLIRPSLLRPHELYPTRFLWPWDFPGKNTGMGSHFLLQRILLTQGSNPHLLHGQADSLPLSYHRSPTNTLIFPLKNDWDKKRYLVLSHCCLETVDLNGY